MASSLSELTQSITNSDPNLKDLLDLVKKDILLTLNCHAIGTIQSFDSTTQTASVAINYPKTFFDLIPSLDPLANAGGTYTTTQENYPLLLDCPVMCLGGGSAALTFPISKGDECLVIFNDRDIDNWFASGQNVPLGSLRLHVMTDAIALVGLRSTPNVLSNYDTSRAVLRGSKDGTTRVAVGETLINIQNDTYNLKTLLQQLITNIKELVTATAAITVNTSISIMSTPFTGDPTSSIPNNASDINAAATALTTTANQIADLLE